MHPSATSTERIVWIVALASMAETLLQAIEAHLAGSWPLVWLWITGSVAIGGLAALVETVKAHAED